MEDKLITIGSYPSISEAYIFKNILEREGLECFVADANAFVTPSIPNPDDGAVRLSVKESDVERALNLIKTSEKV